MSVDALVDELRSKVAEMSEGKLTAQSIDPAGHLFDYGYVDSLSAVMFIAYIEERWGVAIEDVDLVEKLTNLRAIAERIHQSL
jgi:acyl carrier protein